MPKQDRPSVTAQTVLAGVWLTARDPKTRSLVEPGLADYSEAALRAIGSPLAGALKFAWVRKLARWRESRLLPGICTHYVARKQEVARIVGEAGPRRLVVLGAGLDGLAYRTASELEAVEVDWPASQAVKHRVLQRLPQRKVTLVPADLSDPSFRLPLSHDSADQTVVVAEGVLMYLDPASVKNVLREAGKVSCSMVFTFVTLGPNGRPSFTGDIARLERFLKRLDEPFLWGVDLDELNSFVGAEGWSLVSVRGAPNQGHPMIQTVPGMIRGEWIAHVSRKSD